MPAYTAVQACMKHKRAGVMPAHNNGQEKKSYQEHTVANKMTKMPVIGKEKKKVTCLQNILTHCLLLH